MIAQIEKLSSSRPTKGFSVFGSWCQPMRRMSFSVSWPAAVEEPSAATTEAGQHQRRSEQGHESLPHLDPPFVVRVAGLDCRLDDLQGLGVRVEPHLGAERHRRHVLAVADRHVRDRRDPERADELVEQLLDREARLGALGQGLRLQVDVRPHHQAGGAVELAGADQVVEQGVDQVLLGVQVLDQDDAALGLDLERGAERGAEQGQAAAGERRLARCRSPTVST